MHNPLLLS